MMEEDKHTHSNPFKLAVWKKLLSMWRLSSKLCFIVNHGVYRSQNQIKDGRVKVEPDKRVADEVRCDDEDKN